MRVAVANLTAGGLSGGYRKYLARLMPLLADDPRVTKLTVFIPPGAAAGLDSTLDVRTWSARDAAAHFAGVARAVKALKPDVVFVPTARFADFGEIPWVAMVRNMEPLSAPLDGNSPKEALKNLVRALEARRACRRATRVIAVSRHVRDFITSRWRLDPSRVGTVYHGVDRCSDVPLVGTTAPTLFTAGSVRPARGLEDVIRALPLLDSSIRLLVAGHVDAGCGRYARRIERLSNTLGVAARVTWAGQLGPEAMTRAFRESTAFVMTSRAEACPNTVLEAMSCGCASVSIDRAPMPEFFGDAALYYPTGDASALASEVQRVLDGAEERTRLREAALGRAAQFTWETTRDRTVDELQHAAR